MSHIFHPHCFVITSFSCSHGLQWPLGSRIWLVFLSSFKSHHCKSSFRLLQICCDVRWMVALLTIATFLIFDATLHHSIFTANWIQFHFDISVHAAAVHMVTVVPQPHRKRVPRAQRGWRSVVHLGQETVPGRKSGTKGASPELSPRLRALQPHGTLRKTQTRGRPWSLFAPAIGLECCSHGRFCVRPYGWWLLTLCRSFAAWIPDPHVRSVKAR